MSYLKIGLIFLGACSPKVYDYQPQGKPGVVYKQANKDKANHIKAGIVIFCAGYFLTSFYAEH